jgi:uncharacterized protein (DUF169 family)
MPLYSEIAESLTESLGLAQPPVAIRLANEIPAGVQAWSGSSPAGCKFWEEAATRVFATTAADHHLCSIGLYTHNLEISPAAMTDLQDALRVFAGLSYVREEDVAKIPVLREKPKYVVYGPLGQVPGEPDVVLLFLRADQTLILSEASEQLEGGMPPAMGRPACAIVPQARNSGRSALSLGCCGARAYLDVLTPQVALYAIPGSAVGVFAERIAALAKANGILGKFHQIRRDAVAAGKAPTVKESLAALEAAG